MKNRPYEDYNAKPVLERLERMIERGCSVPIEAVYDDLSIFDWWPNTLTVSHMKQMRTFLKLAIELGYDGYVCFKVGAAGCANGMWAHKVPTTTGYSPDGDAIYRSFTPSYTYYSACVGGEWIPEKLTGAYDGIKTAGQLKKALVN